MGIIAADALEKATPIVALDGRRVAFATAEPRTHMLCLTAPAEAEIEETAEHGLRLHVTKITATMPERIVTADAAAVWLEDAEETCWLVGIPEVTKPFFAQTAVHAADFETPTAVKLSVTWTAILPMLQVMRSSSHS